MVVSILPSIAEAPMRLFCNSNSKSSTETILQFELYPPLSTYMRTGSDWIKIGHGSGLDRTGSGLKAILNGPGLDQTAVFLKIGGSGLDRTEKIFFVLM